MMNKMEVFFSSRTENIIFIRAAVVSFLLNLDLEVAILNEIKTVVSEAVTNSIVHGYESDPLNVINVKCSYDKEEIMLEVIDQGIGINDVKQAKRPMFTTKKNEERSGLGFTIMEAFSDELLVESIVGEGTTIKCIKKI
ncbi:anti-sigma F factor [Mycoplasmatota bacterium]|nr:anti-sigma F factor [Mycoplasmatota bacterium]